MLQNLYNEDSAPDLTVLGWGTLSEGGPLPRILNYVKLPYVDHGVCRAAMSPYPVFDEMLCAGDVEKGQIDACQGDSGGPIVYRKVNKYKKYFVFINLCLGVQKGESTKTNISLWS